MEPFVKTTGRVAVIDRPDIDTDQVIPKQFLRSVGRGNLGKEVFYDWRYLDGDNYEPNPEFELNLPRYQGAQVLLTRDNFGCGSSREHAPWALMEYGFRCIIGPSFADIFYNNSLNNGLVPAIVSDADSDALFAEVEDNEGCRITVELESQEITSPGGIKASFEIKPQAKRKLLNGLDNIGLTLQHEAEITAFEERAAQERPWVYQND